MTTLNTRPVADVGRVDALHRLGIDVVMITGDRVGGAFGPADLGMDRVFARCRWERF